jgi:YidC/Oxa1 family membrane protein insertase
MDTTVKEITVETEFYIAVFTNKGAGLKSFVLKRYKDDKGNPLDLISRKVEKVKLYPFYFWPFDENEVFEKLNNVNFLYNGELSVRVSGRGKKEILFRYAEQESNLSVVKKFIVSDNSYVIGIEHQVVQGGEILEPSFVFGPDLENNVSADRALQSGLTIGAYNGDEVKSVEFRKQKTQPTGKQNLETADGELNGFFHWAAYETTYFAAIFRLGRDNNKIKYNIIKEKSGKEATLHSYMLVTNPGLVYLGPKDEGILAGIADDFVDINSVVEYGWFGSIAKIMLKGITLVHGFVPNYGWAIIIFTLFLKVILFPLTYSSSVSMAKMQTLQPKIKAIKKKFKNQKDPEQRRAMNAEMMALYKTEKVNPAGGCLPLLLQLPILWGLFRLLAVSISVRHEPWILWLNDLSVKDAYYVLPILMGMTQILLQKMTPTAAEGAQKKMMYIMPVVIVIFVMNLPSGLTLYWTASNILQIGQQKIINDKIYQKKKDEEKEKKTQKRKKGPKKR